MASPAGAHHFPGTGKMVAGRDPEFCARVAAENRALNRVCDIASLTVLAFALGYMALHLLEAGLRP